ncbi:ImmA/IrrE family metallo-endopeptidase [Salsipaludibacter albus]|uniref:ImmA/IrrE family metallo-endopeptidase n=1 Tax=Salsipaludibacter albus TaxID=2849650 RepID=UPI001EE4C514|nr:ImmA/IrrE family metallo-endopeptidase [Salsipaludibacter albus]MBY5163149.1 ImmA/IrrE family metallo-endopeptidase [Salsipaludibacter albus]
MAHVRVAVRPEMLHWAMTRSHRPATDFKAYPLEEWLEGKREPTLNQLEKFARTARTPIGLMLLDDPPGSDLPLTDYRTIRSASVTTTSAELEDAVHLVQRRQTWYRDYLIDQGQAPNDLVRSATTRDVPGEVADRLRDVLDFGLARRRPGTWQETRNRLVTAAESAGVLVMIAGYVGSTHRGLDVDEFRGFCLVDDMAPALFVNGKDSKAAQMFTLLHELGHILLGRSALDRPDLDAGDGDDVERWCNAVAANVLVPLDDLRARFEPGQPMEDSLRVLTDRYRASGLVVLSQLHHLELLTWERYIAERDAERTRALEALEARDSDGGNYYATAPHMISPTFLEAVARETRAMRTTYSEAMSLLHARSLKSLEGLLSRVEE